MTSDCREFQNLLEKYLSGTIGADLKHLEAHAAECRECRDLLQLDKDLYQNLTFPQADSQQMLNMRRAVLSQIRTRRNHSLSAQSPDWVQRIRSIFFNPAAAYALAVILLIIGFGLGRWTGTSADYTERSFVAGITQTAMMNTAPEQMNNSPYIFSNVQVAEAQDGQVELGFEVSRYLQITRPKSDPLVREVIAQAILGKESLGRKLETIAYSGQVSSPKIKQVLIYTIQNDPNVSVRLKALEALFAYPDDSDVQNALMKILQKDDAVQMRLRAIDYLSNMPVNRQQLLQDLENNPSYQTTPVLLKARSHLEKSN